MRCPLCGHTCDTGATACGVCGARLDSASALHRTPLGLTGEFAVPDLPPDLDGSLTTAPPASACAWCGRGAEQVRKLLGTSGAAICDGCVALCASILDAELGPGWR